MEISLLLLVAALFVGVLVIKSVVGLAVRYALFVAVAVFAYVDRYGPDVAAWIGGPEVAEIALAAGAAMVGTWAASSLLFRRSRWRFLLTPVTGVLLTVLATRVLAG